MMKAVLLLLCFVGIACGYSAFQIAIPVETVNTALKNQVVPLIVAQIASAELPPHCCYDHVDAANVHLNFEELKISNPTAAAGSSISTQGLKLQGSIGFTVGFNYRLCYHLFGCDTLYGCKGDATITIVGDWSVVLHVYGGADGRPSITASNAVFTLAEMQFVNFCDTLKKKIEAMEPTLAEKITAAIDPAIDTAAQAYISKLSTKIPVSNITTMTWSFNTQTSTIQNFILLEGDVTATYTPTNTIAPYKPRLPLPSTFTGSRTIIRLADSLLNSYVYTQFYEPRALKFIGNTSVIDIPVFYEIELTRPPILDFINATSSLFAIAGQVLISDSEKDFNNPWGVGEFSLSGSIGVTLNASQFIIVQIEDTVLQSLNVTLLNMSIPIEKYIDQMLNEIFMYEFLPQVNVNLKDHGFPLPTSQNFVLKDPSLSFGSGYVEFDSDIASTTSQDSFLFLQAPITCPDIGDGSHQDDCHI